MKSPPSAKGESLVLALTTLTLIFLLVYVRTRPWGNAFAEGRPAPGLMPMVALILSIGSSGGAAIQATKRWRKFRVDEVGRAAETTRLRLRNAALPIALGTAYVGTAWVLLLATLRIGPTVSAAVIAALLALVAGIRSYKELVLLAAASGVLVYLLFVQLLGIYVGDVLLL